VGVGAGRREEESWLVLREGFQFVVVFVRGRAALLEFGQFFSAEGVTTGQPSPQGYSLHRSKISKDL